MPDFIQYIDEYLIQILNVAVANSLFDSVMPFVTDMRNWILVYVCYLGFLLWKGGANGRLCVAVLVVTLLASDPISSQLIKGAVGRLRPCHALDWIRVLVDCGPGKSFPSSHAVNNFAAAFVLSYFFRQYKYVFYSIATIIAYSRVYVGVHYPIDVASGAIIGVIISFIIIKLYTLLEIKYFPDLSRNRSMNK